MPSYGASTFGAIASTNIAFTLDGSYVGSYVYDPQPMADFQYGVPVYMNTSLSPDREHLLTLQPGISSGRNGSVILFDYVTYT